MKNLPRIRTRKKCESRVPQFRVESSVLSLVVQVAILLVLMVLTYSLSDPGWKEVILVSALETEPTGESELLILAPVENADRSLGTPLRVAKQIADEAAASAALGIHSADVTEVELPEAFDDSKIRRSESIFETGAESEKSTKTSESNDTQMDAYLRSALDGRKPANKPALIRKYGGSAESEAAVARALDWIARHQAYDGGWTFAHDQVCNGQCGHAGHFASSRNAATALALLPFLGAGQTHREGLHQEVIQRGIKYLTVNQRVSNGPNPTGSWHEAGGTMYSHCLASIAICEAYAMTADSDLREPAQWSIDYLVKSQDRSGGGWRYEPKQPGDTSVVGWAVMALKSGKMAALDVPSGTLKGVDRFLKSVSSQYGTKYGYVNQRLRMDGGRPTTAIGLLCRMYQGSPQTNAQVVNGASLLAAEGPQLQNLYGTYYTAQVLRHLGGRQWEAWNHEMRDPLIERQETEGHASGSWQPNGFPDMGGPTGGRLYSTSMATMILEVYYRHMPLYSDTATTGNFE